MLSVEIMLAPNAAVVGTDVWAYRILVLEHECMYSLGVRFVAYTDDADHASCVSRVTTKFRNVLFGLLPERNSISINIYFVTHTELVPDS